MPIVEERRGTGGPIGEPGAPGEKRKRKRKRGRRGGGQPGMQPGQGPPGQAQAQPPAGDQPEGAPAETAAPAEPPRPRRIVRIESEPDRAGGEPEHAGELAESGGGEREPAADVTPSEPDGNVAAQAPEVDDDIGNR